MDFLGAVMKFKFIYVYILIISSLVIFLIISFNNDDSRKQLTSDIANQQMPKDEIHKGLTNPLQEVPTEKNVSDSYKHEMEMVKKAVEKNPSDTSKLRAYAELLSASHKQNEAEVYFKKILKIDPNRSDILFSLTFISYDKQDYVEAENYSKRILEIDKTNHQALYNLGAISASMGNKLKAKEIWNKLIEKFPASESAKLAKSSLEKL